MVDESKKNTDDDVLFKQLKEAVLAYNENETKEATRLIIENWRN